VPKSCQSAAALVLTAGAHCGKSTDLCFAGASCHHQDPQADQQLPNVTIVRNDKVEGPVTLFTPSSYSAFGNIYDWSLK